MFSLVEPLLKFISIPKIRVDNFILVCHYRVTSVYLLLVAIIITSKVTLVDNINCHPRFGTTTDISLQTLQVHCYYSSHSNSGETVVPQYYQYLPLIYFISALGFTAPKLLYQIVEKSLFEQLIGDLVKPLQDKNAHSHHMKKLAEWLQHRRGSHFKFAVLYFLMDIIYVLQHVGNIFVFNSVLDGNFITYGTLSDLTKVFPHKVNCTYEESYEEATLIVYSICYLNLNNIAAYATLFLWYWLLALTMLTVLLLFFDMFYVTIENFRIRILDYNSGKFIDRRHIKHILRGLSKSERFGELVFMNILVQNLDHITCNELYNLL